jgi:hypothetical protein
LTSTQIPSIAVLPCVGDAAWHGVHPHRAGNRHPSEAPAAFVHLGSDIVFMCVLLWCIPVL